MEYGTAVATKKEKSIVSLARVWVKEKRKSRETRKGAAYAYSCTMEERVGLGGPAIPQGVKAGKTRSEPIYIGTTGD